MLPFHPPFPSFSLSFPLMSDSKTISPSGSRLLNRVQMMAECASLYCKLPSNPLFHIARWPIIAPRSPPCVHSPSTFFTAPPVARSIPAGLRHRGNTVTGATPTAGGRATAGKGAAAAAVAEAAVGMVAAVWAALAPPSLRPPHTPAPTLGPRVGSRCPGRPCAWGISCASRTEAPCPQTFCCWARNRRPDRPG